MSEVYWMDRAKVAERDAADLRARITELEETVGWWRERYTGGMMLEEAMQAEARITELESELAERDRDAHGDPALG